jgi:hypothetical protein
MNIITKQIHKPISNFDILKCIRTRIINYDDLKNFKKLDDAFINDSFVILIRAPHGEVGHWVCCCKRQPDIISYFDSMGRPPDPSEYLIGNGDYPYLSKLLYESPYVLEYNEYDYQAKNTSTCGRHCIVRILLKDKPLEEYQWFMSKFKNDDVLVTAITSLIQK